MVGRPISIREHDGLADFVDIDGDLRVIVAAIKVNADLERIGDLAVNIAEASRLR